MSRAWRRMMQKQAAQLMYVVHFAPSDMRVYLPLEAILRYTGKVVL